MLCATHRSNLMILRTLSALAVLSTLSMTAAAAEALVAVDVGKAFTDGETINDMGIRTGYFLTFGPLLAGPEAGVRRLGDGNQATTHMNAGVRVGFELLTMMSIFTRYEGIGADSAGSAGMTYGLAMDFNKVPMVNMGVHGAWTKHMERKVGGGPQPSGFASAGIHAGLRF
jgi:hypothetical protein